MFFLVFKFLNYYFLGSILFCFKIAFYSTNMFISIGLDPNTWAVYATIVIDIFKVLITVVCMLLIEISGRRKLLITGLAGMVVSCLGLAIFPDIPVFLFYTTKAQKFTRL